MTDTPSATTPPGWRLTRITCKDYGPFQDLDLSLDLPAHGGLLLLEGPNGSGKTSLLEAIALLIGWRWGHFPSDELPHVAHERTQHLSTLARLPVWPLWISPLLIHQGHCSDRFTSTKGEVSIHIAQGSEFCILTLSAQTGLTAKTGWYPPNRAMMAAAISDDSPPVDWAAFAFRSHQPSPQLDAEGPATLKVPALRGALSFGEVADGGSASLGQFLINLDVQHLRFRVEAEDEKDEEIRRSLLAQAAAFERQIATIAGVLGEMIGREVVIKIDRRRMAPRLLVDGSECPIELLGEGYRHTIAWMTNLLVRLLRVNWQQGNPFEQPFWLLLDEVDQSLHPSLQSSLLPAIRRLFPNAFILASTHSPFTVASCGEGQVLSLQTGKSPPVAHELTHGLSLEWVVENVFGVDPVFIDPQTREKLAQHHAFLGQLASEGLAADSWLEFLRLRAWLKGLNEEVSVIVAMRERPMRAKIEAALQRGRGEEALL